MRVFQSFHGPTIICWDSKWWTQLLLITLPPPPRCPDCPLVYWGVSGNVIAQVERSSKCMQTHVRPYYHALSGRNSCKVSSVSATIVSEQCSPLELFWVMKGLLSQLQAQWMMTQNTSQLWFLCSALIPFQCILLIKLLAFAMISIPQLDWFSLRILLKHSLILNYTNDFSLVKPDEEDKTLQSVQPSISSLDSCLCG